MDFYSVLNELEGAMEGLAVNPYAGRDQEGNWVEGFISIDFLNTHFGGFETSAQMIQKSQLLESESLELYFRWLVDQGKVN